MIALLTNDDGIEAAGLAALYRVACTFFDEVWVVAPVSEMSQIGHRVTTDTPIAYKKQGERRFAVTGTPADCTRVALTHLMPVRPDWVLSGINHGGNLGRHDFVISGTVAAVREAAFAGIRGISLSHFLRRGIPLDWTRAADRVAPVIGDLLGQTLEPGHFWNINLPHPAPGEREPGVVHCGQERHSLQVHYEEKTPGELTYAGDYHERSRLPGSDVDVCFRGDIAVTLASL